MELIKTKQNKKKFSEFFLFINEKHPIKNLHSTAFQVSHRAPSAYLSCLKKNIYEKKVRPRERERKKKRASKRANSKRKYHYQSLERSLPFKYKRFIIICVFMHLWTWKWSMSFFLMISSHFDWCTTNVSLSIYISLMYRFVKTRREENERQYIILLQNSKYGGKKQDTDLFF